MRYIGELVKRVRNDSNFNLYVPNGTGVQSHEIVNLLNDAQGIALAKITTTAHSIAPFQSEAIVSVVQGTETYNVRGVLLHDIKIIDVQYRSSEQFRFRDLTKTSIGEINKAGSLAYKWALQNGAVVIDVPEEENVSELKVIYEDRPPRLGLRAGLITEGTGKDGYLLTMKISYLNDFADKDFNADIDRYFSVVDKDGNILMRNIPFKSISSGTFSLDPYNYQEGESCDIGDYIVLGRDTSTHFKLGEVFVTYLVNYAVEKLTSSKGASEAKIEALRRTTSESLNVLVDSYLSGDKDATDPNIDLSDFYLYAQHHGWEQ